MGVRVLLSCRRCGARACAELNVYEDDNSFHIPEGTLNNNWALRWVRSHAEPAGRVLR